MTTELPDKPRFLPDENLSRRHAAWLRSIGEHAKSISEVGLSGASDEQVWEEAQRSGSVLVSLDAHFANLLRYPPQGTSGVIWLKLNPSTELAVRSALARVLNLSETFAGGLFVVEEKSIRIRRSI